MNMRKVGISFILFFSGVFNILISSSSRADDKRNKANEKENDNITKQIIELTGYGEKKARGYLEKSKLWEAQGHKCLYIGKEKKIEDVLSDKGRML